MHIQRSLAAIIFQFLKTFVIPTATPSNKWTATKNSKNGESELESLIHLNLMGLSQS